LKTLQLSFTPLQQGRAKLDLWFKQACRTPKTWRSMRRSTPPCARCSPRRDSAASAFRPGNAVLQPGWWTLVFGAILVGAWSVGGALLVAAAKGEAQQWRFRDGVLTIEGVSAFSRTIRTIGADDIAAIHVGEKKL
jgi:anti-sigma factor RsiW